MTLSENKIALNHLWHTKYVYINMFSNLVQFHEVASQFSGKAWWLGAPVTVSRVTVGDMGVIGQKTCESYGKWKILQWYSILNGDFNPTRIWGVLMTINLIQNGAF